MTDAHAPLLIELGVEEMPAGVAPALGEALQSAVAGLFAEQGIAAKPWRLGVTPRRLLLHTPSCPLRQPDREEEIWGPPEHVAFADGRPTKAAEGFARKTGITLDAFTLAERGDGKGRYLKAVRTIKGRPVAEILADSLPAIIRALPCPKTMRWQDGEHRDDAFIRPVRWIVARHGDTTIDTAFAGVRAGRISRGHRVHGSEGEIDVNDPFGWLEAQGVIADRDRRIARIRAQLREAAERMNVRLVEDEDLIAEVADLTEWPVVVPARFDEEFLRLPEELIRIELKQHQRCFMSRTPEGGPSPVFFAVANLDPPRPEVVAGGNARVVNARLADGAFYFDRDPEVSLEDRVERLNGVVFQEGLGMVGDQVRRLRTFVLDNAARLGVDANLAQRAAYLCKSDLTTGIVYEFPELQGTMGGIYARMQGEPEEVARAIAEHYMPESADDPLPESPVARAIGIAERADKLLGYFHLGRRPTASADPYGLRRAAIGLIRLLAAEDHRVNMTLGEVLAEAAKQWNQQRVTIAVSDETCREVREFVVERWLGMPGDGYSRRALAAALGAAEERPAWRIVQVARLLAGFAESEKGQAVAAANKRIANILKKAGTVPADVDPALLAEPAEKALYAALLEAEDRFPDEPAGQLERLAGLREPVDRFFDEVLVMAEDPAVRANRLALLARLRRLFLHLADVSQL